MACKAVAAAAVAAATEAAAIGPYGLIHHHHTTWNVKRRLKWRGEREKAKKRNLVQVNVSRARIY